MIYGIIENKLVRLKEIELLKIDNRIASAILPKLLPITTEVIFRNGKISSLNKDVDCNKFLANLTSYLPILLDSFKITGYYFVKINKFVISHINLNYNKIFNDLDIFLMLQENINEFNINHYEVEYPELKFEILPLNTFTGNLQISDNIDLLELRVKRLKATYEVSRFNLIPIINTTNGLNFNFDNLIKIKV